MSSTNEHEMLSQWCLAGGQFVIFRVRLQVYLLDYFLENFKFLFRFEHVNQFEHYVFRNELLSELASKDWRAQLSNEFVL